MKRAILLIVFPLAVVMAAPASAQSRPGRSRPHWYNAPADVPWISLRPFLDVSSMKFSAVRSFDAVFGETSAPFWGGGLQVVLFRGRVYTELGASRLLKKNAELVGERVFVNGGNVYRLGIPLRSTIEPFEITAGYRFNLLPRVVPYVGAGVGRYHYTEESDFSDESEQVDVTERGFVFQGGAELRLHRWIGIAADARYSRVPLILGVGGVSREFAQDSRTANAKREASLGGWAGLLKVVVGR